MIPISGAVLFLFTTLRDSGTVRIFTSSTADAVPLPLEGKDNNAL